MNACLVAPAGWWCSRVAGHDGPCAARPIADAVAQLDEIARLKLVVSAYNSVADAFINKVETGQARSRETYAGLKAARRLAQIEGM